MRHIKDIFNILEDEMSSMPDVDSALAIELLKCQGNIFIAGAGRSALIGSMFAMRLAHLGMAAHVVGEVTTPPITSNDILLIISGSGETGSMVNIAQKANKTHCKILLISANMQTTLSRFCHLIYLIGPIHNNRNVANLIPLGGRFELTCLMILESTIMELMRITPVTEKEMQSRHANLE